MKNVFRIRNNDLYDDLYLWSNQELKIEAKDLKLTLITFWNLLDVKCSLENLFNSPIRSESVRVNLNNFR